MKLFSTHNRLPFLLEALFCSLLLLTLSGCSSKSDPTRSSTESQTNTVDDMLVMHDATPAEPEPTPAAGPGSPAGAAMPTRPLPQGRVHPATPGGPRAPLPQPPIAMNPTTIRGPERSVPRRIGREDVYASARERMIADQLVARGLTNEKVLDAMRRVPRHNFVEAKELGDAYVDRTLSIGHNFSSGQLNCTLETPYVVASAAEQLTSEPPGRVLEVGAGTGYQTGILSLLANQVYALDESEGIAQDIRADLVRLDFTGNVTVRGGDISKGWPDAAGFFDSIVYNRDDAVPPAVIAQLKLGGRVIVPVKADGDLHVFQKMGEGQLVPILTRSVRPASIPGNQVEVPVARPIQVQSP